MLDASAKLPKTGMLKGRRHFPGNMDSCLEIKAAASDLEFTGEVDIAPFLFSSFLVISNFIIAL